jgi:LysR family transcriptional regulator, transcriptional activator of nhaA
MEWLNYHHLLYFWVVAREGSIAKASKELLLAQPTITGQIRALENALGAKLFTRSGRNLVPTEVGRIAYRYANEIFSLGREFTDVLKGRPAGLPIRLVVGVSDDLPKLIAYRLIEPALTLAEPVQIVCYEGQPETLMTELATFGLDVVLSDAPIGPGVRVRAFSHLLGSCGVTFFAKPILAAKYRKNFPASLDGAPMLLPLENTAVRRSLEQWFEVQNIRPRVVGQFQDSALLKVFGQAGVGLFAAPTAIEQDVRRHYKVSVVGRTDAVTERFYAISVERKLKHPAVVAISESARQTLFGQGF